MNKATRVITYKTEDYSQFKKLIGNRQIDARNVGNIMKNIQKNGLLPTVVICNEKMEVIDGQHRIEALKKLNLPVYYQVHRGLALKDCIAFNVSSKKWTAKDYIYTYASKGNENYKKLIELSKKYKNMSDVQIAVIATRKNSQGRGILKELAKGKFRIKDLEETEKRCEYINSVKEFLICAGKKNLIIPVLSNLFDVESVDMDRLKEQLQKRLIRDFAIANTNDALDYLTEIYNYRKKVKTRFKDEYLTRFGG